MKDIDNNLIEKINKFFITNYKEIPIEILKTSNNNAYLCLFKYVQPENSKGICIYCNRKTNIKSKAGYICSSKRKSKCRYIFICPVCNKIFIPQHAYQCISKKNITCSHKCLYEITINKWKKENPEEAHKEAIKNGYKNIGIMRKSLEIIQKNQPEKFKKWCSNGGKIGGVITAEKYPEIWKENLKSEIKYCKLCNSITYYQGNTCMECDAKSKGFKSKLDKQIILQNNYAISLGFKNWGELCISKGIGFHTIYCKKCNKETLHNGFRCSVCDPWPGAFDRDKFYSSTLSLVSFNSINKQISLEEIDNYNKISGIWSIECSNGQCLEVCETQDMGKEMKLGLRCIKKGYENINKSDLEIIDKYKNNTYKYIKYRDIAKYSKENEKVIFKIIIDNVNDKEERFNIEAQYAHDTKALFWSTAPGQTIM